MTDLNEDNCVVCEAWKRVNRDGLCHKCWTDYRGWVPPSDLLEGPQAPITDRDENDEYRPTIVAVHDRADAGGLFDNFYASVDGNSWKTDKRWKPDEVGPFGVYHRPADPPVALKGQQRPWQRYSWQVKGKKTRTAPERIANGVSLRCLVCLVEGGPLRRDQVCEACERNWRDHGRPWDSRYDSWVIMRRRDNGQPEMVKVTGVPSGETGPSTCDVTKSSDEICYNGVSGDGNSDPAIHEIFPSEDKMVEVIIRGEPVQVAAAIRQMGTAPVEPEIVKSTDTEPGKVVALRRPS